MDTQAEPDLFPPVPWTGDVQLSKIDDPSVFVTLHEASWTLTGIGWCLSGLLSGTDKTMTTQLVWAHTVRATYPDGYTEPLRVGRVVFGDRASQDLHTQIGATGAPTWPGPR